jgi:hypothetical protein
MAEVKAATSHGKLGRVSLRLRLEGKLLRAIAEVRLQMAEVKAATSHGNEKLLGGSIAA